MDQYVAIKRSEEQGELRMVWAEVYAPNRPDSYGDYMTAEEIRKAAYNFMKQMRLNKVDQQHDNQLNENITIIESFIARSEDPTFIPGSWVVGVHVDDDQTWAKVKRGEINGFSLEALVLTEDQEVEIEVPPVISGKTDQVAGHEHEFYAAFDEEGKFLGGRTNMIDGHFHVIKSGTLTEIAKEHSHRFSMMDDIVIVE